MHASQGGETFLQSANNVQQPSLTRLRELVPPWPLSLYNRRVDGRVGGSVFQKEAQDMRRGQQPMNASNSQICCCRLFKRSPAEEWDLFKQERNGKQV